MVTSSLSEQARAKAEAYLCDCEATREYRHSTEVCKQAGCAALDAYRDAVRADTLSLVEQEARRRADAYIAARRDLPDDRNNVATLASRARYESKSHALNALADFCRQQREGNSPTSPSETSPRPQIP